MKDREAMARLARAMAEEKRSIREIARTLQVHRDTVKKMLGLSPGKPRPPRPRPSKLDPFRERVRELAESTHEVGRKEVFLTVKSIFRTLRKEGYEGGMTILGDLVREIRGTTRKRRAFARYEPPPGLEAQMDWSPYEVAIGGRKVEIHVFSLILSYSRYQYLEVFLDEKQDSLFQGHVEAFRYVGGIPMLIWYDNQTPVVICRIRQPLIVY